MRSTSVVPAKGPARVAVVGLVVVLLLPTLASGLLHGPRPASQSGASPTSVDGTANVTVVAAQGDDVSSGGDSRLLLVERGSRRTVREWTRHATYYDVDVLNETTLLYIGVASNGSTFAYERNWRTGEVYRSFQLPDGSHDVDSLGNDRYAYVNGSGDKAVVYDYADDEVVWEYSFRRQYPPEAGNGPPDSYAGDYTHLNDIDPVDNATKFLLSPRNFDRVVLVNRSTKETVWTLGAEDDHSVLYEQHNPDLVRTDLPTVLVADSENDRVVEYRMGPDGEWHLVWEYAGDLVWPRDADRLDNGNTLIVDSRTVVEVTPGREVVWGARVPKYLYDVERIGEGDDQRGPSMAAYRERFETPRDPRSDRGPVGVLVDWFDSLYQTAGWVLPWWLGKGAFALLVPAVGLLTAWGNVELRDAVARREVAVRRRVRALAPRDGSIPHGGLLLGGVLLVAGTALLTTSTLAGIQVGESPTDVTLEWWLWDPGYHAVGLLLLLEGAVRVGDRVPEPWVTRAASVRLALVGATVALAVGLLYVVGVHRGRQHVSNPRRLLSFASVGLVALVVFVRRPGPLGRRGLPLVRRRAAVGYVAGLALASASLAVLGVGLDATVAPESYVLLAFVLLLAGDRTMARATLAADVGRAVHTAAVLGRYLLRPVWLVLAAGVVLQLLGFGAVAGVGSDLSLLSPLVVGLALVCLSRLLGPAGGPTAVDGDLGPVTDREPDAS